MSQISRENLPEVFAGGLVSKASASSSKVKWMSITGFDAGGLNRTNQLVVAELANRR